MCGVFVLNNLLRAEGQVRFAMLGTVAGNLVNVALDPLLLFRAEMGVGGAALALLISQAVSFLLLLGRYLCGKTRRPSSAKDLQGSLRRSCSVRRGSGATQPRRQCRSTRACSCCSTASASGSDRG